MPGKPNLDNKIQEWRVLQEKIKQVDAANKVLQNKKHTIQLNSASCILPKSTEAVIKKEALVKSQNEKLTSARIEIVRKSVSGQNQSLLQKKRNLQVIKTA